MKTVATSYKDFRGVDKAQLSECVAGLNDGIKRAEEVIAGLKAQRSLVVKAINVYHMPKHT